jgi:hydrogenase/urease accessory protein HupE
VTVLKPMPPMFSTVSVASIEKKPAPPVTLVVLPVNVRLSNASVNVSVPIVPLAVACSIYVMGVAVPITARLKNKRANIIAFTSQSSVQGAHVSTRSSRRLQ